MSAESRVAAVSACSLVGIAGIASVLSSIIGLRLLDEGYILYNSWLMSLGRVPYRDFWLLYPPGMFALLSGLFRVFGPWAVVGRATVLACALVVSWSTYRLIAPVVGRARALVSTAIVLAWGVPVYNTPFPNWYSLAAMFAAGVVLKTAAKREPSTRDRLLIFAGMLVGLSTAMKQSIGLLSLVAFCAIVAVLLPAGAGWRGRGRSVLPYLAGAAIPILGFAVALAFAGAGPAAAAGIFVFPFTHVADVVRTAPRLSYAGASVLALLVAATSYRLSSGMRSLLSRGDKRTTAIGIGLVGSVPVFALVLHRPVGGPLELLSGAAWGVAFYALPLVAAAAWLAARHAGAEQRVVLSVLSAVGLVMFFERGGALDWSHLVYVVPSGVAILALALVPGSVEARAPRFVRFGVMLCAAVMFAGPLASQLPGYAALLTGRLVPLPRQYAGIFTTRAEAAELAEVSRSLSTAPEGAPVYVYPVDAGLYFMALRPGAGRFAQFVYRLNDSESAEESRIVVGSHPAVVVVRVAEQDNPIGFARWSENGRSIRDSVLIGRRLIRRTRNFEIYGGGG
jgi:hypothetical protein